MARLGGFKRRERLSLLDHLMPERAKARHETRLKQEEGISNHLLDNMPAIEEEQLDCVKLAKFLPRSYWKYNVVKRIRKAGGAKDLRKIIGELKDSAENRRQYLERINARLTDKTRVK